MDWTPGGVSSDIEDRRDSSGGGGGGFGFGGGGGGGLGIAGFVIVLIISLVTGHNFLGSVMGGGSGQGYTQQQTGSGYGSGYGAGNGPGQERSGQDGMPVSGPVTHPAGEDRDVQLISFVLDDAQKTWTGIFQATGKNYRHAKLVIYRGSTYSGCGTAEAQTGPFYCPEDQKIYIDLGFWDELKKFGGDTGDFAQAYVITHELGHHVQNLLGIMNKEQHLLQAGGNKSALSVDLELQADCFSGVWAHTTEQRGFVHPDDIAGALKAAAAVGDDHLERMSGRAVSPESFTHGTSAQREEWFRRGLDGGTVASCDTFGANAGGQE